MKCALKGCDKPATKKVIWADGRAYQPSCAGHVKEVQNMLTAKNGKMTELAGVQDLSDTVDLVASAVYPGLERVPGKQNWVDYAEGLPKYIERIAKHLHYERGFSISRAIPSAVNTVKRWARMGKVAKYGDPNHKHVSAKTAALAAKAVAEWEAKRAKGRIHLTDAELLAIDLTEVSDKFALDLAAEVESIDLTEYDAQGTSVEPNLHAILSSMDIKALAQRANEIEDPEARAAARTRVLELAFDGLDASQVIDLASTIAPRNARGRATDGRRSYRGQGKWKHGFIPINKSAKEAKAKGSPIAIKRLNRLFGRDKAPDDPRKSTREVQVSPGGRVGNRGAGGRKNNSAAKQVKVDEKVDPNAEKANDVAFFRHQNTNRNVQPNKKNRLPESQKEASKSSRIPNRARQNWDEIPESLKTVRNGKRYVLAEFGGRGYLTEWVGGVQQVDSTALAKRKVMRTLSAVDAANMKPSELRALINNPRTPDSVKRIARKALRNGKVNSRA